MHHRHRLRGYLLFSLLLLGLLVAFFFLRQSPWLDPEYLRDYLLRSGSWGLLFLALWIALAIPLPLPSAPFILLSGYLYGTWIGSALSLVGMLLGSLVIFLLVRKLGRPFLKKMVDPHHLLHFEHVFKRRGISAALISYAVPVFPSDAISAFLGLTKTRMHTFLVLVLLGHIPRILLMNSLGNDAHKGISVQTLIVAGVSLIFVLIAWYREKVKKFVFRELHELEAEAAVVEKEVEDEVEKVEEEMGMVRKRRKKKRA